MNGNATPNELSKVEQILNSTARFTNHGLDRAAAELSNFQTIEQTNLTLNILVSLSRDHAEYNAFIVSLNDLFFIHKIYM